MTLATRRQAEPEQTGRLPSFVLIGATKCGTTSLHDWLTRHPDVWMSPWKEMRFFLPGYRWERGLDWYRAQFAEARKARAWGEASNGYGRGSEHPGVPARMANVLPDARLIYLIRDPMKRLASHYRHRLATGREARLPADAVRDDPAYVETGRYGAELERWLAHWPRQQILVIRSERLFADPAVELDRVAAHLRVTARPDLPLGRENRSTDRRTMPAPLRQVIATTGAWRTGKRLSRLAPVGRRLSEIDVTLPEDLRAEIVGAYEQDRAVLGRHVPPEYCDWTLT